MSPRLATLAELGRDFRRDSAEVLAETRRNLAAAEATSETLNAFIDLDESGAEAAAGASADRYARGAEIGPLDGIPITVKDSFHVRGLTRWHGSASSAGAVSRHDSAPVRRLREAGAVILGKTTMPDFGMLATGIGSQFGITRNPWSPALSPGGSSAGAGAALAAGIGALAVGTDIAGSVRLPAAHCGLVALKPTQGSIAYAPESMMRSAGPMSRTVADNYALFSVIARPDPEDPWCLPGREWPARLPAAPGGARIGVISSMGYGTEPDRETRTVLAHAAETLAAAGYRVTEVSPGLGEEDFLAIDLVLRVKAVTERLGSVHPERTLARVREWSAGAEFLSAVDLERSHHHISAAVARLREATAEVDYLLAPVIPVHRFAAEAHGPDDHPTLLHHTQFTAWFNQSGQPALALPAGLSAEGLPLGVQVIGARADDLGVYALGAHLESLLGLDLDWPVAAPLTPKGLR